MSAPLRILTMAHGHPEIIRGGAEVAAKRLHDAYLAAGDTQAAWLLARADLGSGAKGRISTWRDGEYLWEQGLSDPFRMTAANRREVSGYFTELLAGLRPTVVHAHHYFQFGLEFLREIKRFDPSIRVCLTLHEYMAICPNKGLMLTLAGTPCPSGDYRAHTDCVADRTVDDLWLRKHRFERHFDHVDSFIAPSRFLKERYVEWGLAADRIRVVENCSPPMQEIAPRPMRNGEGRRVFGFFGQINPHKGLDHILEGLLTLGHERRRDIVLEVHGANLERQEMSFQRRIGALAEPLIADGTLRWKGAYGPEDVARRMAGVDWVIVPSVWYENAPLVIQEAHAARRPVLASDFGALPEMVADGRNGLLLPRADGMAWAERMADLARDTRTWDRLTAGIAALPTPAETAARHIALMSAKEPAQ